MTVLRVYRMKECDAEGKPLDWNRCRTCDGTGALWPGGSQLHSPTPAECPSCDGHGSLKAAALAMIRESSRYRNTTWPRFAPNVLREGSLPGDKTAALDQISEHMGKIVDADIAMGNDPLRCEDCGHPMSDGTWEGLPGGDEDEMILYVREAWERAVRGRGPSYVEERYPGVVHYSPCDEGCRHGGPGRWEFPRVPGEIHQGVIGGQMQEGSVGRDVARGVRHEASWRSVDVRTLDWPHDLRPESLAILCLRCWAARCAS